MGMTCSSFLSQSFDSYSRYIFNVQKNTKTKKKNKKKSTKKSSIIKIHSLTVNQLPGMSGVLLFIGA